ncbi:Metallo-dependent phosphatase-like protein [Phyllosticta citricarpa]|uniref:Vacuolar protein sorting-associated protein 29 n=1 Tax=Phyllosticta citricarpa TaxID=55181 RepID=A0ABR1MLQ8_9PEZI
MTSRLVLCLGDLFIPDRASVSPSLHAAPNADTARRLTHVIGHSRKGRPAPPIRALNASLRATRSPSDPEQFKKLLAPGKIGQILCLGNLTDKDTYDFLRSIAPDLQIVKGDFDVEAPNLALSKVVTHGSLRIGFTHGHTIIPPGDPDSLLIAARQMDVDVLLWGGTHRFEAYEMEGKFFVNPGSATGAMTTGWWPEEDEPTPSFVLMDIQGDVLVLYVYQLRKDANGNENVGVEKVSFRKNGGGIA